MSVFVSTGLISTPGAPCNLKELQKTILKGPCDSKGYTHTQSALHTNATLCATLEAQGLGEHAARGAEAARPRERLKLGRVLEETDAKTQHQEVNLLWTIHPTCQKHSKNMNNKASVFLFPQYF